MGQESGSHDIEGTGGRSVTGVQWGGTKLSVPGSMNRAEKMGGVVGNGFSV